MSKFKNQTTMLKKFEKLMKPIIIERDGGKCLIAGYGHPCSATLVVDHRPSKRGNHATFLDPRNLNTVCSNANMQAEFDPFVSKAIMDKMIQREGQETFDEIFVLKRTIKKWSEDECIWWVKKCKAYFKKKKNGKPGGTYGRN
jgi:hypothetical protein